jgi:hypothetical protein
VTTTSEQSAAKQASAEGCSGFLLAVLLFFASFPFGIWAYTISLPVDGEWRLFAAGALVYVPALIVTAVLSTRGRLRSVAYMAIFGALGAGMLGSSIAVLLNTWLDGEPHEQTTRVISHREHTRRSTTTRYLTLEPWPPLAEPHEIEVERETYEHYVQAPARSQIVLYAGEGALGMHHLALDWGTPKVRIPR